MTTINQKEYLKKYLGIGKMPGEKKKRKKKEKAVGNRLKIIDDDVDALMSQEIEEDIAAANEDAPQIVAVIDERPIALQIDEQTKSSLWKPIGEPSSSSSSAQNLKVNSFKLSKQTSNRSDSKSTFRMKSESVSESYSKYTSSDRGTSSIVTRIKEEVEVESSRRSNREESPVGRNENASLSPPRRKRDDSSPLRERGDGSPSGKSYRLEDYSPPRRSHKSSDDSSPPRRRNKESDSSPPKRVKIESDDNSPPRKINRDGNEDYSPPRRVNRDRNDDNSPPRRKNRDRSPERGKDHSNKKTKHQDDYSPPRRHRERSPSPKRTSKDETRKRKKSRWSPERTPEDAEKMRKTLDGKRAGLQNAKDLSKETRVLQQKEDEMFKNMSAEVSGRNAATVTRAKKTKDLEEEAAKEKRQKEMKEKYDRWGKGLKQVEDQNRKMEEQLHEMSKPLARYADDEDLEKYLKEQEREGDPMLAYIRKKKRKEKVEAGIPEKPTYMGEFMPNRFGIRPGYRWDGVDRSNEYEKKFFEVKNKKKADQEEAFKWSTEDM